MKKVKYGRKIYSFEDGSTMHTCTSVTEKPFPHEDETTFTSRLMQKYEKQKGTVEVVFKSGYPDYAIVILPCENGFQ